MGVCCICGQPLGAPSMAFFAPSDPAEETTGEEQGTQQQEDLLLTEECEVRLSMMRFNMLGVHHEAHILDDYTFLEGRRNNVSFWKEFETHGDSIVALNPSVFRDFKKQVENEVYNTAVANMQRTVAHRTVCACQRCNKAMTKTTEHTMAVFRCFHATRGCRHAPLFETRTLAAGAARKALQQIALYFTYEDQTWSAKEPDRLLKDTSLWRCVAYLNLWGTSPQGAGVRYLLVALFHAAHYIYLTESTFRRRFEFEAWHVYVWRSFYASRYNDQGTFFGMLQNQAASTFDIMQRTDGALWIRLLTSRFRGQRGALLVAEAQIDESALRFRMSALNREVHNERELLLFLRKSQNKDRKGDIEEAVKLFLNFFKFNLVAASAGGMQKQFWLFVSDIARSYRKIEKKNIIMVSPYYSSY